MARSSGQVGSGSFRENFSQAAFKHEGSGTAFRLRKADRGYELDFSRGDVAGKRTLEWFIGSGTVGRSYLFSTEKLLFQAPVSYYSTAAKWDVSPGFQSMRSVDLTRAVDTACLQCHATGVKAGEPVGEGGVGCERCHGDGGKHAVRMAGRKGGPAEIVNPAKLDGERRDSVCAQCHLTGAARVARADAVPYKPGARMADSVAVFVWEEADSAGVSATSHFDRLAASKCWRASAGKLWCGTCHSPHGEQPRYRERCESCHRERGCVETVKARQAAGGDCLACHMPKRSQQSSEHLAFTDHAIPRRPGKGEAAKKLRPFWESSDRDLALAYAVVAPAEPAARQEAFDRMVREEVRHPRDVPLLSQLAQFYDRMGREEDAATLCERILALDPDHTAALVNLGIYRVKRQRVEEAMTLWRKALARNPAMTAARVNLGVAQYQSGHRDEARATFSEALKWDPGSAAARRMLDEIVP
jgi:hypothetical protein